MSNREIFVDLNPKEKLRLALDSNSDFRANYCLRISFAHRNIMNRWDACQPELKLPPSILPGLIAGLKRLEKLK